MRLGWRLPSQVNELLVTNKLNMGLQLSYHIKQGGYVGVLDDIDILHTATCKSVH